MRVRPGLAAVAVGTVISAVILPGPVVAAAAPAAFTLRYSARGWTDVIQTGAAVLACPPDAGSGCLDGSDATVPTVWLDVDQDPSTVNSSRAVLTIPPKASVDWVGLYWAGDRGTRGDGGPPHCDAAPDSATPPTLPPAPDQANQVKLAVGDKPYTTVTANSLTAVSGPNGGSGFQGYVDITTMVRPGSVATAPVQVPLRVAELQVASGPGCGGGWTVMLAYSYQDGPDKTYAPTFRGVVVFDGTLAAPAGARQDIQLEGLSTPTPDGPPPRLTSALLASGQALGPTALALGAAAIARTGTGVTGITGQPGSGYHQATSPVPASAVKPGAALGIASQRNGFVAAVLGLSTPLPVKVNLSVAVAVSPSAAVVGAQTTLTVTVNNAADLNASGVKVAVRLAPGLKLAEEAAGHDAGTGIWSAGSIAPHGSAAISLRVLVEDAGDMVSTAQITASDLPNQNQPGENASVAFTAAATPGPTASTAAQASAVGAEAWTWSQVAPATLFGVGLFLLGLLLLFVAVVRHRARTH